MKRRRGFTIIEMLVGTVLMGLALSATLIITAAAFRSQTYAEARSVTSNSVHSAIQLLVRDLEHAKDAETQANELRVRFAVLQSNGIYDRTRYDDSAEIKYYLGDSSGKRTGNGAFLWRLRNGALTLVCRGIDQAKFSLPEPGVVRISIQVTGERNSTAAVGERSVLMRNH